jgi:chemotaxis protein histidine kinase CheA
MSSLEAVVSALRRSDARSSAPRFLTHAAVGAAAWVGAVLFVTRLVPYERRLQLALLGIPVMVAVAAIAWLASRPGPGALMSGADQQLGLKERLSTAWERRASSGVMDELLRLDALQHAERARLARAFPIHINRREFGVLAIVALAALLLAVLPNPMDQLLAQRRADAATQATAANAVHAVQDKIAANAATVPPDPKVQKILSSTEKQIRDARDPRQALQAISPAEQQLQALSDPQTPARTSTAQNLASSLSATKAGKAAGQALTASPAKGAQALRELASQLQSLTPQERAQLAQALATAAQHAQDPAMAASLSRAASALAAGDNAAAAAALGELAGQLDSLQAQQNTDAQVAAGINSLEAARQALAAQADRDAAAASGSAGAGASPAAGTGNGSGSTPGNGNSGGNGSGSGSGSGNGSGSNGLGNSGSGSGSGQGTTPSEKLFVPGQPVPGQLENDPTPLGPGQDVPLTPYTQVVQAYRQAALDATSQSLIPGSEQDLVRQYFSTLGGS